MNADMVKSLIRDALKVFGGAVFVGPTVHAILLSTWQNYDGLMAGIGAVSAIVGTVWSQTHHKTMG